LVDRIVYDREQRRNVGTGDLFFIGELVENRNKLPVPPVSLTKKEAYFKASGAFFHYISVKLP